MTSNFPIFTIHNIEQQINYVSLCRISSIEICHESNLLVIKVRYKYILMGPFPKILIFRS